MTIQLKSNTRRLDAEMQAVLDMRRAFERFIEGPATEGHISPILETLSKYTGKGSRARVAVSSLLERRMIKRAGWSGGRVQYTACK